MKQRKSNRLKRYDYSSDNLYFVTSCVHNRICCFGEIIVGTGRDPSQYDVDKISVGTGRDIVGTGRDLSLHDDDKLSVHPPKIILNEYGKIAEKQWHWLAEQYPYVVLHAFVVMPNHIHGIIEINRNIVVGTGRDLSQYDDDKLSVRTGGDIVGTGNDIIGTGRDLSLQNTDLSIQPKIKSLSELMGAYKTTVSKQIHLTGFIEFQWQRSFHEHIIHTEKEFITISDYILRNPLNWKDDKLNNF